MTAHRVANGVQARVLLDVSLRPLLNMLMERPCTVSEAAQALGLPLGRAHYLITKLLKADVAVVASTQPRAGRAVKRYAVAEQWFIPFAVTGEDTLDAFINMQIVPRVIDMTRLMLRAALERLDGPPGYWLAQNYLTFSDEADPLKLWELLSSDEPLLLNFGRFQLAPEQARRFKRRLVELMNEFEQFESASDTPYSFGFLLVKGMVD